PCASRRRARISRFASLSSAIRTRGGLRTSVSGLQVLAYLSEQLARTEWLGDVAVAPGFPRLDFVSTQGIGRDCNYRNGLQLLSCPNLPRGLVAIETGKLNVHQNQIGTFAPRQLDALVPINRLDQCVPGCA